MFFFLLLLHDICSSRDLLDIQGLYGLQISTIYKFYKIYSYYYVLQHDLSSSVGVKLDVVGSNWVVGRGDRCG